jgi:hypothetical protein
MLLRWAAANMAGQHSRLWQACKALTGVTFPALAGAQHHDPGQLTRGDDGRACSGAGR